MPLAVRTVLAVMLLPALLLSAVVEAGAEAAPGRMPAGVPGVRG